MRVTFDGSCLKQEELRLLIKKWLKFILLMRNLWPYTVENDSALGNCLFGAAKSTKILLILVNINILDVVLNLMYVKVFLHQMVRRLVKT